MSYLQSLGPNVGTIYRHEGYIWGLLRAKGTFLDVPTMRTTVFRGLYCGPPIYKNSHVNVVTKEGLIL